MKEVPQSMREIFLESMQVKCLPLSRHEEFNVIGVVLMVDFSSQCVSVISAWVKQDHLACKTLFDVR